MAAYMEIEGIPGQANDSEHKDWIPCLSVSQSVDRPLAFGQGVDRQASTVTFQDIVVTTKLGKHVPKLAELVAKGGTIGKVVLDFTADMGAGKRESYYKVELSDVMVSQLTVDNAHEGGAADSVMVGLNFAKIDWTFTQWDDKGKKVGETPANWNVAENTQ